MNVVIEGIDASGKTRLARAVAQQASLEYVDRSRLGHGPPKSPQDVISRLERYLQEDFVVFDRHTAVSQPIYGALREDPPLPAALIDAFYKSNPVIIYARCIQNRLKEHVVNAETDSPKHLTMLYANYDRLLAAYDQWAMKHALIWYTDYRQLKHIGRAVQGILGR
jgi:thymidylate kinase